MLRLYMLGGSAPSFAVADNPISHEESLLTRTLTFIYLPVFNFMLFLWPAWLSFDWSMDAVKPVTEWRDVRNLYSFIFYTSLAYLFKKAVLVMPLTSQWLSPQTRSVFFFNANNCRLIMAMSLLVIPFIPASNVFFYVGFVVAERVLYLPSMGFCLLLGCSVRSLTEVLARRNAMFHYVVRLFMCTTLVLWSLRTIQRNGDWCQEEKLYRSAIIINPAKGNWPYFIFFTYLPSFILAWRISIRSK